MYQKKVYTKKSILNSQDATFVDPFTNLSFESIEFNISISSLISIKKLNFMRQSSSSTSTLLSVTCCHFICQEACSCQIIKYGYFNRMKLYDSFCVSELEVPKYYCKIHRKYFSLIQYVKGFSVDIGSTLISLIDTAPVSLIFFSKYIITLNLFKEIITLYNETFNFEKISRYFQTNWSNKLKDSIQLVYIILLYIF